MRALIPFGALALIAMTQPAPAQMMCGPGQQAQASTPGSGGMMCGGSMGTAATEDPMADKPAQKSSGMCPCCRNMAMMRGGKPGGMQHNMPGMEMPKQ